MSDNNPVRIFTYLLSAYPVIPVGELPTLLLFQKQHTPVTFGNENKDLFEELRVLRKKLADQQAIPAYIVLSDKTLHLIATQQPTTIEAFGNINGIGEYKKEKYGKDFIELIKKVLQE